MFDQKAYNKTVRALIKDTKKAGHITYDDLTDKVATPYTLDAKQMDKLLETISDAGISVVDAKGEPDARAVKAQMAVS